MLTNDNFFKGVDAASPSSGGFTAESVNLAVMPMFHIAGAGWSMVGLYYGCQTVVLRDVDPARDPAGDPRVRRHATRSWCPAVIQFLLMTPGVERPTSRRLRPIVYGASPITDKVLVEGDGDVRLRVHPGLRAHRDDRRDHAARRGRPRPRRAGRDLLRSCGKPYPWVEVRIVDAATGEDAPPARSASCWTRSHQNMKGYWNNPEATAEAITADGWFRTGDAGYLDDDGYLYLHDRVKDMIVSGGENVYPAEVENALMAAPGVADVAVIGVPDEHWGEAVKAIVVRGRRPTSTEDELIAFAAEHLARLQAARSPSTSPTTLPRNPSGKLLKRELREPYWEGATARSADRFIDNQPASTDGV